jgi:hypothetical protein
LIDTFKTLCTALAVGGLLAACGGGGSDPGGTTVTDSSGDPGSLVYNPPLQVTALTAAQFTERLEAGGTAGQTLLAVAGAPKCGVSFRYIEYGTVGGAGERTNATGALMVPTGGADCTGPRPIVLYAHGTTERSDYNIADITDPARPGASEGSLIAAFYAAQGFIVVAPNYAGYDKSTLGYHPYLDANQQSTEMRNALAAARKALPAIDAADSGKLFITGYSQGGHVAMATHRAMQAAGETVTASAPLSGPYAMAAFADAMFYGNVNLGATMFLPMLTTSYQKAFPDLNVSPVDIYEPQYAAGIGSLMPSTTPFTTLLETGKVPLALFSSTPPATGDPATDGLLTAITPPTGTGATDALFALGFGAPNLINNQTRLSVLMDAMAHPDGAVPTPTTGLPAQGATSPLRVAAQRNDLRGWAPNSPVLMCAGNADPTVFYAINTGLMAQLWTPLVSAGLVTVLDVDSAPTGATDPFAAAKVGFATAKNQVAAQGGAAAVTQAYHGTLVPPFCSAAARGFFQNVLLAQGGA